MDSSVNTVRGKKNNVLVLPWGPGLKTFFFANVLCGKFIIAYKYSLFLGVYYTCCLSVRTGAMTWFGQWMQAEMIYVFWVETLRASTWFAIFSLPPATIIIIEPAPSAWVSKRKRYRNRAWSTCDEYVVDTRFWGGLLPQLNQIYPDKLPITRKGDVLLY